MPDNQRADARRNYAHILAVAEEEVAEHGADASLEQIARRAGVGSATVRRHFPGRRALLTAVSKQRVDALRVRADDLAAATDSRAALLDWLGELVTYCVSARGLAVALTYDSDPLHDNECAAIMQQAAEPLLERAARDGVVARDVTATDLVTLVVGIALATENFADPLTEARHLLDVAVTGLTNRS